MTDPKATDPRDPRGDTPAEEDARERPDQIGIIPGKIPGQPTDPHDPRFPASQPDLA
ncbi:MAG TPA: hypothetical protein VD860_14390 [Azospirillum sp.]|nr:hypothetical protein [Azospirillum sp.]